MSYHLVLQIRETQRVSVMNVGYAGGIAIEGPYCKNGKAERWRTGWGGGRYISMIIHGEEL